MTREFFAKVLKARIYDTRKYRYIVRDCGDCAHIERLSLKDLDTMSAFDCWEVVAVYAGKKAL